MNYLDRELHNHLDSLTYPDKLWVVMDDGNETPCPYDSEHEAREFYWRMKDMGEDVRIGYVWDGSISGRTPYDEVDRIFKEVRV